QALSTIGTQEVLGFSTDKTPKCKAIITANCIKINCEIKPKFVYYNWSPYTVGNLINHYKLPTSTFKLKVK
ncbi:MAG TPA: hypothetical protein PKD85_23085, partial [Saprospiraceae bacterium]|nr:hypothetical protein [Saprospiraceae bacterium]